MASVPPKDLFVNLDLYTFSRMLTKEDDDLIQGLLNLDIAMEQARILTHLCEIRQPLRNTVRYLVGRFLNNHYNANGQDNFIHFRWVSHYLKLEEHQDRRLRRHANGVDAKVAEGNDILEVLKLPALTLRGAKSQQDREVEQNLEALRTVRNDLQDKIVTKN